MKCYSEHPRLIPQRGREGGRSSPEFSEEFQGGVFLVVAMESLLGPRISRISRFHQGAWLRRFSECRDEISGGLRRRRRGGLGLGGIKSREGHSFVPHSLIMIGLRRLSGINDMGVKKRGVKRGRTKKKGD
ncbi:hypothetical protein OIU79_030272 [Salix purpurea]|uniref:Uncharacterized protein n=1 Tax=Salix purpurea TaxID=77065 RepID=A0A9Q0V8H9_SALPP|nr:hypothetical protein OIU79_030272 [Salix purpurea]